MDRKLIESFGLMLLTCSIVLLVGIAIGGTMDERYYREQAVARGFAEWKISNEGAIIWRWKQLEEIKK